MLETIILVGVLLVAAVILLLASSSGGFGDEDEELDEGASVELTAGGGGHGYSHHQAFKRRLKADIGPSHGSADIRVRGSGPFEQPYTQGRGGGRGVGSFGQSCSHCGAANQGSTSTCWSCGSNPDTTISSEGIASVNKRLRDAAADNSYFVHQGEEPRPDPVESPAVPDPDAEDEKDFTKPTSNRDEDIPFYHRLIGRFIGWLDKWRQLTSTHMKSMFLAAAVTLLFWGVSLVYGAFAWGSSGVVALLGATIIAVMSGAMATLFALAPGRGKTIGLAYPFAMSTLFLPAIVIALYEPSLNVILELSYEFAAVILDVVFAPVGLADVIRSTGTLQGEGHFVMWFVLSFPLGWVLGTLRYGPEMLAESS